MNEEEIYNKLSDFLILKNEKNKEFINAQNILTQLRQVPKEQRQIYDIEIGFSPKLLKFAIDYLNHFNLDIKKFSEYIDEMNANFRHYLHYIEDNDIPSVLSDYFTSGEYGSEDAGGPSLEIPNLQNKYKKHKTKYHEEDVFPSQIINPGGIFSDNKTKFEDFTLKAGPFIINKLTKALSCLHVINIPQLNISICGTKPINLFFNEIKENVDDLYQNSQFKKQDYFPKYNLSNNPALNIKSKLKNNHSLNQVDHLNNLRDENVLKDQFLLKW